MSSPSDFAKPVVKFDKLDDLPKKAHTPDAIMAAMKALHKMIHAQAKHYGGKHSKLLPAGIAENSLLKSIANGDPEELMEDGIDNTFEDAYLACSNLQKRLSHDQESMDMLLAIIEHVNKAFSLANKS